METFMSGAISFARIPAAVVGSAATGRAEACRVTQAG